MNEKMHEKIPVGISACLLGDRVRYNAAHKLDLYLKQVLGEYFEYQTFCPEVDIGLGVPRNPIRLERHGENIVCVDIENPALDYTRRLLDSADARMHWISGLCGYIFKSKSPSCGMEQVDIHEQRDKSVNAPSVLNRGSGIFAGRIMQLFPALPVEEEGRLRDAMLRENFIQRVHVMYRWRQMMADGLSVAALTDFHARHKLILMSHCQKTYRQLGPLLATARKDNVAGIADQYLTALMAGLKKTASRGDHVNVLLHIQGYLRGHLQPEETTGLRECFDQYLQGEVPLIVPITLLERYFRRYPHEYISRSWYMHPCPGCYQA